jgi:hypothetical protein
MEQFDLKSPEGILLSFIDAIDDPTQANAKVALQHAHLAREYFAKKEADAVQKRSAAKKVSRAGSQGGDEPANAPEVGSGDAERKTTASSHQALRPSRNA